MTKEIYFELLHKDFEALDGGREENDTKQMRGGG